MITLDQLRRIMPGANAARLTQFFPHLSAAMDEFEINTPLRAAAFLAQLAHESGQLRFMEEIWGPTAAQRRYEPVTSLSRTLGNTQPGDGFRFKGRGPIQLTGRANYQRFGQLLGLDLVGNPPLAATPDVAFRIAGLFWKNKGLNQLADQQNFREITRRINGGFNGLQDRLNFYNRAKTVLGTSAAPAPPPSGGFGLTDEPVDTGGGAELSRGILPGDPAFARLLGDAGASGGAKKAGAKKPAAKKAGAAAKKSAAKKSAPKKGGAKAGAAKAVKKSAGGKKGAAKSGGAKKPAAKKSAAKKPAAKKPAAKKSAGKKGAAKSGARKGAKSGARKR